MLLFCIEGDLNDLMQWSSGSLLQPVQKLVATILQQIPLTPPKWFLYLAGEGGGVGFERYATTDRQITHDCTPICASSTGKQSGFSFSKKFSKFLKKDVDKMRIPCYYVGALRETPQREENRSGRVVELVDSLDSGSSVHCGRAGSSPASPTRLFLFIK